MLTQYSKNLNRESKLDSAKFKFGIYLNLHNEDGNDELKEFEYDESLDKILIKDL